MTSSTQQRFGVPSAGGQHSPSLKLLPEAILGPFVLGGTIGTSPLWIGPTLNQDAGVRLVRGHRHVCARTDRKHDLDHLRRLGPVREQFRQLEAQRGRATLICGRIRMSAAVARAEGGVRGSV
jgi:hypothetical protein